MSTTKGFVKLANEISLKTTNASYLHMSVHQTKWNRDTKLHLIRLLLPKVNVWKSLNAC